MAKERERKFLLKDDSVLGESRPVHIHQAYLVLDDKMQVRVRIIDSKVAYLTLKHFVSNTDRDEFEYQIPLKDAEEMFNLSYCRLEKKRVSFIDALSPKNGGVYTVDIDVYPSGKKVVEIEYQDEMDEIPNYCGEEVTNVPEYSNVWIAKHEN